MNNEMVLNEVKSNNNNSIALVTKSVINSHCIVCNSLFTNSRIGKLYCSSKCKQYRFNHKQQLQEQMPVVIEVSEFTPQKLFLKDYTFYATKNAKLKRFRELQRKVLRYQDEERKIEIKKQLGFVITSEMVLYMYNLQLNDNEQCEYDDLTNDFEDLMQFDAHSLTLEQWSFFKVLYPKVNNEKLFTIISQLSREYINQLNLESFDKEKRNGNLLLNAKYIAFCNEIANGKINFI